MWLVWKKNGGMPTHVHQTEDAAKQEAERLARQFRNDEFIVFESVASVKIKDVEWTHIGHLRQLERDNEIPF